MFTLAFPEKEVIEDKSIEGIYNKYLAGAKNFPTIIHRIDIMKKEIIENIKYRGPWLPVSYSSDPRYDLAPILISGFTSIRSIVKSLLNFEFKTAKIKIATRRAEKEVYKSLQ
jgi:hypothetical protein